MKIFLGYASERETEARTVFAFLQSLELEVWFDKESVLPGEEWRSAREKAQDAADMVVHIVSPEISSRPGEVQRELKRTLDLAENRPFGVIYFIPILVAAATIPVEISKFQYVEFERPDWAYRVAKSVSRRFEQAKLGVPGKLDTYLRAEAAAGGRVDLKISDQTPERDLQADYFRYSSAERYFEYVNAKVADNILTEYYGWRRNETTAPAADEASSTWQCRATEFFKRDKLVSIQFDSYSYWMGAAHGHTNVTGLNFAGEDMGVFELSDLFDKEASTLRYLVNYIQLELRQQLLSIQEDEPSFLCDFTAWISDPEEGWRQLENFNFDNRGIVIHFNPYAVMAFAYGHFQVRLDWEQVQDRLSEDFRIALASILPKPNS